MEKQIVYKKVPTYDASTDSWTYTFFNNRQDFVTFLWSIFKEPGKYNFNSVSLKFNEQARNFERNNKVYTFHPINSKDFINYWDTEKEKNTEGVIFKDNNNTWYLSRGYYMWLNFLPIYNKEKSKFGFADVRDAQYHMALYEELAKYSHKHVAILKKRQIASSYFHAAVIINYYWFDEGFINKIAASLKDYINEKGTWRFLEEYRNFLNNYTAWYRSSTPDKIFNWEQKIEVRSGNKKLDVGLKSVIIGLVLDKDVTNGVGGPCGFFFHEEAGIAKKMNETLEYLLPALKSGMGYTGMFAVAGSVGDLEQCEPLKELILNPDSKDVLAVHTDLIDDKGESGMCGLFIPEQWSMLPCIDEYGNSLVEESLEMIFKERAEWKKKLKPEDYQLRISQKPTNIKEAFAYRKTSKFPLHLVTRQMERIQNKEYFLENVELMYDDNGIKIMPSNKLPIKDFPINPQMVDKEGVIVMHERPIKNAKWGTYIASIDPVSEGKTVSSESLCSIYIYKTAIEVTRIKNDGSKEVDIEPGKLVAWWCGRFDDLNKTHKRLEMMLELYNAQAIIENNISLFIQYMFKAKKTKYLIPKKNIAFLKEMSANSNVFQEYGWKNTGVMFRTNLLSYAIQFLEEELDVETKTNGDIVKRIYGIERISDIMLLKEMFDYQDGLNVDRLVAFSALVAYVAIQESNLGYVKHKEYEKESLNNTNKISKLNMNPFRNISRSSQKLNMPFKRLK